MPQVLTPTGYKDVTALAVGDEVCAFDADTGAPIVNHLETLPQWVDAEEFKRWQNPRFKINNADDPSGRPWFAEHTFLLPETGAVKRVRELEPGDTILIPGSIPTSLTVSSTEQIDAWQSFTFCKINATWTLNSEQSIWKNGSGVCHARDLVVGDTLYDDANNPFTITSIEAVTADGWYRFDIDGDHSYIIDGLTVHNASRFAVNAGGVDWTWDLSTTTHWASSSGGAGGQSPPGSADAVTFDASSGGHIVTPSYGGTGTFQSITCGAFTGTLAWNTNNNSVTLSSTSGFNGSGSGTRTISLGNGTWTISATSGTTWNLQTTTGLTFSANSSTIAFVGNLAAGNTIMTFQGGGLTYSTVSVAAQTHGGQHQFLGVNTFATLTFTGQSTFLFSQTQTITNCNFNGTSSGQVYVVSAISGSQQTLTITTLTANWVAFRDILGSGTANNSFNLGNNSGITINAPSTSSTLIVSDEEDETMARIRKNGSTSNVERVRLRQDSTGANPGYGKTGLTNASSGLIISTIADNESSATTYTSGGSTIQTITTLGTYAAPSASNCRFKEIDSTNHPGEYELQFADARYAVSGAKSLKVTISGVSGMLPRSFTIQLSSVDVDDATRGGMTALPNANAASSGGLPTSGTGANQIDLDSSGRVNIGKALGTAVTLDSNNVLNVSAKYLAGTSLTGRDIGASVLLSSGTGSGQLDFTSGVVKANATQWIGGTIPAVNVTGVPLVDAKYLLGTIFAAPNTAGLMDVNTKQAGGTAWGSGAITAGSIAAAALNGKGDWVTSIGNVTLAATQPSYAPAKVGDAMTLTSAYDSAKTAASVAGIFANAIETGITFQQLCEALGAYAAGKRSNCGTPSEQYDALGNPGTARIVANADSDGNGTPTLTL